MPPLPNIPWTESPFFEAILAASGLAPDAEREARFFREHGYLLVDLDMPGFDRVAADVVAALEPRYGRDRRIQDAWRDCEGVRRIATHPPVLERLRMLFGREPIPFQTLNFRLGSEQMLHSDAPHFNSVPERFMVGVWAALEDVDEANGPLTYVPGSHRLPIWKNEELGLVSRPDKAEHEATAYRRAWEEVAGALGLPQRTLAMRKGQAMIWAANLLHGGAAIRDPRRTRHSQVTHCYFEDCCYYTPFYSDPFFGRVAFRDIVDIRTGAAVPNRYNGQAVPEAVRRALDPRGGINGMASQWRPAPATVPAAAGGPARELLAQAAQLRLGGIRADGLVVNDGDILLHPGEPGAEPATLALGGLPFGGRLEVTLALRSDRCEPVRFAVEARADDAAAGTRHEWTLAAGEERRVAVPLPGAGPGTVSIGTAMAPGAGSAAFAWAYLAEPRLLPS